MSVCDVLCNRGWGYYYVRNFDFAGVKLSMIFYVFGVIYILLQTPSQEGGCVYSTAGGAEGFHE